MIGGEVFSDINGYCEMMIAKLDMLSYEYFLLELAIFGSLLE